jgi:hypothetical protein
VAKLISSLFTVFPFDRCFSVMVLFVGLDDPLSHSAQSFISTRPDHPNQNPLQRRIRLPLKGRVSPVAMACSCSSPKAALRSR